jgi:hypothetical protein
MSIAVLESALYTSVGVADGRSCKRIAATAATFGAEALVPENRGTVSLDPKKVLLIRSGPIKRGFSRTISLASRFPDESNLIGTPPRDEKGRTTGRTGG